jgi:glycosyltransferase involved in cell wall biosynthesis
LNWPVSLLENYNLQHTDGIIAGNLDGAKILRQRGYQGAVKVMPQLGVDETLFRRSGKDADLSRRFGIEPTDFVVGFVGTICRRKRTVNFSFCFGRVEKKLLEVAVSRTRKIADAPRRKMY